MAIITNRCDDEQFQLFQELARQPINELDIVDFFTLAGHDRCCGERMRREEKRQQFLMAVRGRV